MPRCQAVVFTLALLLTAVRPAEAAVRTWVSTSGSDANDCSRSMPCRNFGAAVTAVDAGGEVVVLDSGGYGPVTINKPVSIICPSGLFAAIAPTSGDAIVINVTGTVILRGLTLNSFGAIRGVNFQAGAALHAHDLLVRNFGVSGIHFVSPSVLVVKNSTFIGNGAGVMMDASSAAATGLFEGLSFERNDLYGLEVRDHVKAAIKNSTVIGGDNGLIAAPEQSGPSELDIENCLVIGVAASAIRSGIGGGTAHVRVSNTTVVSNEFGLARTEPSTLESRLNNTVEANVTNGSFSASFTAK
jgi:hypothetical protein